MSSILETIASDKRIEVERLRRELPLSQIRGQRSDRERHRLISALRREGDVHVIAELKKASPSKGILLEDFHPGQLASKYAEGGASALSVLTESKYFQGRYDYMAEAAASSGLPILCKDFTIDPYQIYHAAHKGADAILLIVALLSAKQIREYIDIASDIGIDCLVEVHNRDELTTAVDCGATIIGVNNRDLNTFNVDLATSERLAPKIPDGVIKVAESGIFTRADVARLQECGFSVFLVGEALVKANDPSRLIRELRQE